MKTIHALFAATLLAASATAMADDGAARVDAQMDAARAVAMRHYDETHPSEVAQKAQSDSQYQQHASTNRPAADNQPG